MSRPDTSSLTFRPLGRPDFELLAQWLSEPHVHRWWCHEFTPEAVERDFGGMVDGTEPGDVFVVLFERRPVGLIQAVRFADYPEDIEEMRAVYPVEDGAYEIDYLIGVPELIGRGVGRTMLGAFVEVVWRAYPDATCIVVPVSSANTASWRALLAAGFTLVARGDLPPDNPIDDPSHEILRLDRPGV